MSGGTPKYPTGRPKFWANRLIRILHKSCAANDIGIEAVHLITVIAMVEDSTRYSKAITFWNGQLLPITGFQSWGRLDRARQTAIDAGWLHFESGGRHKAGKYWAIIPAEVEAIFSDATVADDLALHSGGLDGEQAVIETGSNGDQDVIETGSNGDPSTLPLKPPPKPVPKERARSQFKPPGVDEVRAYCTERANAVDAETFVNFNQSKGWMVGKSKMKDWKAAVRTWEKRENHTGNGKPQGISAIEALDEMIAKGKCNDMIAKEQRSEQF